MFPPPPLQRLTMIRDDPAKGWLSPSERVLAAGWGLVPWILWALFIVAPGFWALPLSLLALAVAMMLLPTVRWAGTQWTNRAVLSRVRKTVDVGATPVDDWNAFDRVPDGRVVSLVGWVRGREHLGFPIDGRPCVGVAIGCRAVIREEQVPPFVAAMRKLPTIVGAIARDPYATSPRAWGFRVFGKSRPSDQRYSEIMETLHDFDLVDEQGRAVLIQVAGGRLIGRRNAMLGDDAAEQAFIASLNLPDNVTPLGKKTFVLRDGDPVMVVGTKTTIADPTGRSLREPNLRATVASGPSRPLLVYGIPAVRNERLAQPMK